MTTAHIPKKKKKKNQNKTAIGCNWKNTHQEKVRKKYRARTHTANFFSKKRTQPIFLCTPSDSSSNVTEKAEYKYPPLG